jgi:hypothetical protein
VTALHALFQRRVDGDDALLRLARQRFEQAGLAAEVYAGSTAELEHALSFAPAGARPPMVHLPRDIDLLDPASEARVVRMATRFGERVSGFVVHDRRHLPDRLPEFVAVAGRLSTALEASGAAHLFVEYAAGLPAEQFASLGDAVRDVERVGLCIDTGHVGVRQARWEFARRRPDVDRDLASLTPDDPALPALVDDVEAAVATGLPAVVDLVTVIAAQGAPMHLHLHDGHPLVPGLADHYGFLLRLPLPFRRQGVASLAPLFGVDGLRAIIATVQRTLGPDRGSLTLEIHQHEGRLPLPAADVAGLFGHWRDLTNAERMNLWLRELAENALLVRSSLAPDGE